MTETVHRINLGAGQPWQAPGGEWWQPDLFELVDPTEPLPDRWPPSGEWMTIARNRVTREEALPLFPESLDGVLRTEPVGLQRIRLSLPPGLYTLRLIVAETYETLKAMTRRFHLRLNGERLEPAIQPAAIASGFGRAGAVILHGVKVNASQRLELSFDGTETGHNPVASGLEISTAPPATIASTFPEVIFEAVTPAKSPSPPAPRPGAAIKRLFLPGHSGMFNWAIPETVSRMVAWTTPQISISMTHYLAGGKNVEHFAESEAVQTAFGPRGSHDFAVIMDSSWGPVEHPETFEFWMPKLIERMQHLGAVPILYAYSGPARFSIEERRTLMARYRWAAEEYRLPLFPCAEALARAEEQFPNANFHAPDRHHVGILTGFLFACVWYRVLIGKSASDLPEHSVMDGHAQVPERWIEPLVRIADATCLDAGITEGVWL